MGAVDWGGILVGLTGLLGSIGLGAKWLIGFIERQANKTNELLQAENAALKDRIEVLEIKLDACQRERSK